MRDLIKKILRKAVPAAEAVLLICILIAFAGPEKELVSFSNEEIGAGAYPVGGDYHNALLQLPELPRGVIEVRVRCRLPEDQPDLYLWVSAENGHFHSFGGNGISIVPGDKMSSAQYYAFEKIEQAQLGIQCHDSPSMEWVESISVVWTSKGYGILFLILLCVFAAADGIYLILRKGKTGGVSENGAVFWGIFALTLLSFVPYMTDYIRSGEAAPELWRAMENLKSYLAGNHELVIPGEDWILIFPAVLRLFAVPVMNAYKAFVLAVSFLTAAAGYAACKSVTQKKAAGIFGLMVYLFYPARLTAVFERFDVTGMAMAALAPVAFLAAITLIKTSGIALGRRKKAAASAVFVLGGFLAGRHEGIWYISAFFWALGATLFAEAISEIHAGYSKGILTALLFAGILIAVFQTDALAVSGELNRIYSQESVDAFLGGVR